MQPPCHLATMRGELGEASTFLGNMKVKPIWWKAESRDGEN